jgi:3-oxoacyl-[acyl-carrier-protein] synthase II
MAEGAAMLSLEPMDAAERRGATILAEIAGFGASTDGHHITAPLPSGEKAALAIGLALNDAELEADAIGYINAHASSTQLNELAEANALRLALGAWARAVPISGTKGLYGHPLGASGAIEAAITALALNHGLLPGTCNLQDMDPRVELNVMRDACPARPAAALSTSFGFGGMNAVLILKRV